jgi:hypothetical protein
MVWTAGLRPFRAILFAFLLCGCAERHAGEGASGQAGTAVAPPVESGSAGKTSAAAGGGAGSRASSTTPAKPGARARATLEGLDPEGPDGEFPLRGEAAFRVSDAGVDMTLSIRSCKMGRRYTVYILEGGDCSSATLTGEHWDGARGEGFASLECGTSGFARAIHTRSNKDAKPWSIEGPAASDLIGHAIAVYDEDHASACGVIMRDETAPASAPAPDAAVVDAVPIELRAQIAGLCGARNIVRDNMQECPNPKELETCSRAHCDIDRCVRTCSDSGYIACLQREGDDPCEAANICEIDQKCADCSADVSSCTFSFCLDEIACAAPVSPDGPCSQLLACCSMQGDMAPMCLDIVQALAKLSGDPSCYGAQHDWDFFSHLPVPCKFQ